jgi:hypothetical protein
MAEFVQPSDESTSIEMATAFMQEANTLVDAANSNLE